MSQIHDLGKLWELQLIHDGTALAIAGSFRAQHLCAVNYSKHVEQVANDTLQRGSTFLWHCCGYF